MGYVVILVFMAVTDMPLAMAAVDGTAGCQVAGGAPVQIAVVDTGLDVQHPLLRDHLAYSTEGRVVGYDFVLDRASVTDANGHGTHVASLIAAPLTAGCVPFRIIPVRVLDRAGNGSRHQLAQALRWAVDQGARVVNISLTYPTYDLEVDRAVQYAWGKGAVIVAAGGNTAREETVFPGGYVHVLAVAASDGQGRRWSGSTWGEQISIVAPGIHLKGAMPLSPSALNPSGSGSGYLTGSSQAAAEASAVVAAVMARHSDWSNAQVYAYIERSAVTSLPGWSPTVGYGLLSDQPSAHPSSTGGIVLQVLTPQGMPVAEVVVRLDDASYVTGDGGILRLHNLSAGLHRITLNGWQWADVILTVEPGSDTGLILYQPDVGPPFLAATYHSERNMAEGSTQL